ncbi:MAG: uroporphyrinogen decarboxylase [Planctomycetes bacterium]|nr:uroporphyrinogen decarboxylase [Planctomycetota bacterium]
MSVFLQACRREPVECTPVWLMRQAGRYMPQYRALRERVPFLDLCRTPDLAAKVTVDAAREIGADAAILFSDILLLPGAMGAQVEFPEGGGPAIRNPVRTEADVASLLPFETGSLACVYEAIRLCKAGLGAGIPLIGFAGGPFTLASYLIEGGGSTDHLAARSFLYGNPSAWRALMEKLAAALSLHLRAQIEAGADAVMLFDSWAGALPPQEYRTQVLPHTRRVFESLPPGTPSIHFGTQLAGHLRDLAGCGASVVGVDHRIDLDAAWEALGPVAIQGNLDPAVLLADRQTIERHASEILSRAGGRPGHIFNLGHGVLPRTPVESVKFLVDFVREESRRRRTP